MSTNSSVSLPPVVTFGRATLSIRVPVRTLPRHQATRRLGDSVTRRLGASAPRRHGDSAIRPSGNLSSTLLRFPLADFYTATHPDLSLVSRAPGGVAGRG
eukprot:scaffold4248_cov231-Pinguiococcus_pyrenoidosus.AAC.7